MSKKNCAQCYQEIDAVNEGYFMVQDNYRQVKYFEDPEGNDNVFCCEQCVLDSLMVERVYDEPEDADV